MKTVYLLLAICLYSGSAKHLSSESVSPALLHRHLRSVNNVQNYPVESDSDEISANNSGSGDESGDNDSSDSTDLSEIEGKRTLQEKEQELLRKQEEKREKTERKRLEKLEKEERKRQERIQKEIRKQEELARKQQEKLEKEERKREEKLRKEIEKLENEKLNDESLESEEDDDSLDLEGIGKKYVYHKYGLTAASTALEKKAALNRFLEEELGLNANSTKSEFRQVAIQLIQSRLLNESAAESSFRTFLNRYVSVVGVESLQAKLENKIAKLENESILLNNISLPWVQPIQQSNQENKMLLQAVLQFVNNLLPHWVIEAQTPSTSAKPTLPDTTESASVDPSGNSDVTTHSTGNDASTSNNHQISNSGTPSGVDASESTDILSSATASSDTTNNQGSDTSGTIDNAPQSSSSSSVAASTAGPTNSISTEGDQQVTAPENTNEGNNNVGSNTDSTGDSSQSQSSVTGSESSTDSPSTQDNLGSAVPVQNPTTDSGIHNEGSLTQTEESATVISSVNSASTNTQETTISNDASSPIDTDSSTSSSSNSEGPINNGNAVSTGSTTVTSPSDGVTESHVAAPNPDVGTDVVTESANNNADASSSTLSVVENSPSLNGGSSTESSISIAVVTTELTNSTVPSATDSSMQSTEKVVDDINTTKNLSVTSEDSVSTPADKINKNSESPNVIGGSEASIPVTENNIVESKPVEISESGPSNVVTTDTNVESATEVIIVESTPLQVVEPSITQSDSNLSEGTSAVDSGVGDTTPLSIVSEDVTVDSQSNVNTAAPSLSDTTGEDLIVAQEGTTDATITDLPVVTTNTVDSNGNTQTWSAPGETVTPAEVSIIPEAIPAEEVRFGVPEYRPSPRMFVIRPESGSKIIEVSTQ